jgi:hypothetical protein
MAEALVAHLGEAMAIDLGITFGQISVRMLDIFEG